MWLEFVAIRCHWNVGSGAGRCVHRCGTRGRSETRCYAEYFGVQPETCGNTGVRGGPATGNRARGIHPIRQRTRSVLRRELGTRRRSGRRAGAAPDRRHLGCSRRQRRSDPGGLLRCSVVDAGRVAGHSPRHPHPVLHQRHLPGHRDIEAVRLRRDTRQDSDTVSVQYRWAEPDNALCCPQGGPSVVTFTLNGNSVRASGQFPPDK
ncbi:LppP/LprE family lipoprotein [Nocardia sp. NPDC052112]|uniref:LppP/LprE family lipoprotein n=1 Tax=Nocardia sp. NPDC052112 TaxID=3155646 RepID=UPI00342D0959